MEMNNSMIFDLETLGTTAATCPVLSAAAYAFDTERFTSSNPYTIDEIVSGSDYVKVDVNEQCTKYGRIIEKDTLEWWKKQDKDVQKAQLIPTADDKPVADIITMLYNNFTHKSNVYTRGNTFDPVIITALCKSLKGEEPYPWYNVRDTRSVIDGLSWGSGIFNTFIPEGIDESTLAVHDPRVDIAIDIMRIQALVIAIS
jgi:hypothetical protein